MRTVKTVLLWITALLFIALVFALDDSYHVRRGETKPLPWEQFLSK